MKTSALWALAVLVLTPTERDAFAASPKPGPTVSFTALLEEAAAYVVDYERRFSDLVAEERYTQHLLDRYGKILRTRVTRSELLFVRLPGEIPWTTFRDVLESDGRPVGDRESRLPSLFANAKNRTAEQAEAILREGARFNLGQTWRNFNLPVAALTFLHPRHQARFVFERKGTRAIEGVRTVEVRYREVHRPALIHDTSNGGTLPARGEFFIDPRTGRVLRSVMTVNLTEAAQVSLSVDFRPAPGLDVWVPREMRERWGETYEAAEAQRSGHSLGPAEHIECLARYSNYRRFVVETQEQLRLAPGVSSR
jgi:hypothetical protein